MAASTALRPENQWLAPHRVAPLRVAGFLLTVAVSAFSVTACSFVGPPSGVIQPSIIPVVTERGSRDVTRDFTFDRSQIQLTVPLERSVYAGAQRSKKSAIFIRRKDPVDWVPGYYQAFVDEKHQLPFYQAMESALQQLHRDTRLNTSNDVELVTSMVQQLEYRTDPVNLAPKFPIETYGDGYGDCDDKTLLAAALLSREGYDVAVLLFPAEKHVALGVRAPGLDYKNTGYAYVEMTEPSLVGIPAENLAGGIKLRSKPTVIKIGEGTKAYGAGGQIKYIQRKLKAVAQEQTRLSTQIDAANAELERRRREIEAARADVNAAQDASSLAGAAAAYNARVSEYNSLADKSNADVQRYNNLVAAQRFVYENQTARPQVYERLRALD